MWPFKKTPSISELKKSIPRDELIRTSRTLFIDDEEPIIKKDLERQGFSVAWVPDMDESARSNIESGIYDLILLDFAGVGKAAGQEEGLTILRHIKRVAPAVVVLSYTSKALTSAQADFYRLTDGVLSKDAGIVESLEKIEQALRKANSPENLWKALLAKMDIESGSPEEKAFERRFFRSNAKSNGKDALKKYLGSILSDDANFESAMKIAGKLLAFLAA